MENEANKRDIIHDEGTVTVYEISYLLMPSIALEQVSNKTASLKATLDSSGAKVISSEDPILIDLAYPITKVVGTNRYKVNSGYFGWVKFEASKGEIGTIKKSIDNNDDIIRYLIIKTVKENTLLHGKMMFKKDEKINKKNESETDSQTYVDTVEEVPKEESVSDDIDKSIDDLVIV